MTPWETGPDHDPDSPCYQTLSHSDEEVDYNKMDQGNKKGPMSRYVFEKTH